MYNIEDIKIKLEVNIKTGDYNNYLRIIKNNKKVNSLNEYIEYLDFKNKESMSVPIYIHRKSED